MNLEDFFSNIAAITVKLTDGCNLKCSYCNVEAMSANTPRMSLETAQRILDLLVKNSKHEYISFEFHGGEPLLMGEEWLTKVFSYGQKLAKQYEKKLQFPLVTNATLLNEQLAKRLDKLGIVLSVSCDGPPHINDQTRQGGAKVEQALKMLKKNNIHVGIMSVIGPKNYDQMPTIMDWYSAMGFDSFVCNFSQPQGRGIHDQLLDHKQKLENKISIIEHMRDSQATVVEQDTLQYLQRFKKGRSDQGCKTCWNSSCQAGRSYVAIDLHGNIHACGSDISNHKLGTIFDDLNDQEYQSKMFRLHNQGNWDLKCFHCEAAKICNFSCATSDYNLPEVKEDECQFTKNLWNYLCENQQMSYQVCNMAEASIGKKFQRT